MWQFHNPVRVLFGRGAFDRIGAEIGGRRYALVTYDGHELFRTLARRLTEQAGPPAVVIDTVAVNPDFHNLAECCRRFAVAPATPELIVAVGGGSVLDTAKALAAAAGDFALIRKTCESGAYAPRGAAIPIIAVPTTAGTGSEVTCWATIWDSDAKKKYSLSHAGLFPALACVDPDLTLSAPRAVTVASGLDALSHALESIWNVNANPVSTSLAEAAAREVLRILPKLAGDLDNPELRTGMAHAALKAGLAFSNTRTALAHSLSYHITLHHGVPHGIACSFSLPMVMRGAIGADPACDAALVRIFGTVLAAAPARLEAFLRRLGVSTAPEDYGLRTAEWTGLIDDALRGERGRNYIGRRGALFEAEKLPA